MHTVHHDKPRTCQRTLQDCQKPSDIWIFCSPSRASHTCKEVREKVEAAAEAAVGTLAQATLEGEAVEIAGKGVAEVDNLMSVVGLGRISHISTHMV